MQKRLAKAALSCDAAPDVEPEIMDPLRSTTLPCN
jgi:hypothetical protein